MAELRRQIEYATGWAGSTLHLADRWYPSSKTCSACGVVKTKLRLSERLFRCDQCPWCWTAIGAPPATSPHSWPR
jgi:putative transposase